jgi:hypothetical protein
LVGIGKAFSPAEKFTISYCPACLEIKRLDLLVPLLHLFIGEFDKMEAVMETELHALGFASTKVALGCKRLVEKLHRAEGTGCNASVTADTPFPIHSNKIRSRIRAGLDNGLSRTNGQTHRVLALQTSHGPRPSAKAVLHDLYPGPIRDALSLLDAGAGQFTISAARAVFLFGQNDLSSHVHILSLTADQHRGDDQLVSIAKRRFPSPWEREDISIVKQKADVRPDHPGRQELGFTLLTTPLDQPIQATPYRELFALDFNPPPRDRF